MKNQNNTPTRSTPLLPMKQEGADTNEPNSYRVSLLWSVTHRAVVIVKAQSQEEAEDKADNIQSTDLFDDMMKAINGDLMVDEVKLATVEEARRLQAIARDLNAEE